MYTIKSTDVGSKFKVDFFDPIQTFECGQCFRWNLQSSNSYIGVIKDRVIEIYQKNDWSYSNIELDEFNNEWSNYFDFHRDYKSIVKSLAVDEVMINAIDFASGIRILKQDEWEALISFIISANNNIPRIKKIIELFCEKFGKKLKYKDKIYFSFPTAKELEGIKIEDLEDIRCGYRAKFIIDAVDKINNSIVDLYNLYNLDTIEARKELLKISGVGPKVADCVLLFSMGKTDCYPMDVWVKKTTESLYFKSVKKEKEIKDFAMNYWGEYAGFAQQYLFNYGRNLKK